LKTIAECLDIVIQVANFKDIHPNARHHFVVASV